MSDMSRRDADEHRDDDDLDTCVICGRPAICQYPTRGIERVPSCGRMACELRIQTAVDFDQECGDR